MNQKHPIDDLFRSKLVDYKIPVREELKEIFLEKSKPKRSFVLPFWILSIAASFIAVLSFFWLSQKDTGITSDKVLSSYSAPQKELVSQPKSASLPEVNSETKKKQKPSLATNVVNEKREENKPKAIQIKSETGLDVMDEVIPDELTVALMESQKPKETLGIRNQKNQNELFKKDVGETMIIIASEFQKDEQILIPELNSDSPITMDAANAIANSRKEANNSLIAKVFTNIKHLKHGEKIDLTLTASSDYSEDTFIGNETREIKEKIDWIKAKIVKR